jgi:hypothetical protein
MRTFNNDVANISTSAHDYLHRSETVKVQFINAAISGLIIGIIAIVCGYMWRWRNPWMAGLIIGLIVLAVTWFILQNSWHRQQWVGLVSNTQPAQPEMAQKPLPVRSIPFQMNRVTEQGHVTAGERFELPFTEEQAIALADGMLNEGMHFTVREWCGAGKPFSADEFKVLRAEMLKQKLLLQVSTKDSRAGGYRLTDAGEALLRECLSV